MIAVYHQHPPPRRSKSTRWRYRSLLLAALLIFCAVQVGGLPPAPVAGPVITMCRCCRQPPLATAAASTLVGVVVLAAGGRGGNLLQAHLRRKGKSQLAVFYSRPPYFRPQPVVGVPAHLHSWQ